MERSQTLLLPESLEDYASAQRPVRFRDAFVEGLDLKACDFVRTEAAEAGQAALRAGRSLEAWSAVWRSYLWGYLNRVRSSRRLELECARNPFDFAQGWLPSATERCSVAAHRGADAAANHVVAVSICLR